MNTQNPGAAYTPPVAPVAGERITLEGDASPNSLIRLLHQYQGGHVRWLNSGTPWVTEDAKAWLARNIGPGDRVLEFGAGRSTIFFAKQASRVTIVEGSPDWALWTLFYLYQHPYLLKKVRFHFCPTDWNPSFPEGVRRYWNENRRALDSNDITDLEADLTSVCSSGNNVVFFDGNIRQHVFLYQIGKMNFDEVEIIAVDNTEDEWHSSVSGALIPARYVRLDFVAGPLDVVPANQNGKHITTLYVREDRLRNARPVRTHVPPRMTDDERRAHMLPRPEGFKLEERIAEGYRYLREQLGLEVSPPGQG